MLIVMIGRADGRLKNLRLSLSSKEQLQKRATNKRIFNHFGANSLAIPLYLHYIVIFCKLWSIARVDSACPDILA